MPTHQRSFFIRTRKKLSPSIRQYYAHRANLHLPRLLSQLPKNANIALYQDDFGELPTFGIIQFCLKHNHIPHLPIVWGNKLKFVPIVAQNSLYPLVSLPKKRHRLGMYEPISRINRPVTVMHACFCPLVAIDYQGNRMGMGGGFYDRTLKHYHGLKIGWCYDFQMVANLPTNPWDIGMDMAITPNRLWRF